MSKDQKFYIVFLAVCFPFIVTMYFIHNYHSHDAYLEGYNLGYEQGHAKSREIYLDMVEKIAIKWSKCEQSKEVMSEK